MRNGSGKIFEEENPTGEDAEFFRHQRARGIGNPGLNLQNSRHAAIVCVGVIRFQRVFRQFPNGRESPGVVLCRIAGKSLVQFRRWQIFEVLGSACRLFFRLGRLLFDCGRLLRERGECG